MKRPQSYYFRLWDAFVPDRMRGDRPWVRAFDLSALQRNTRA